MTKEQLENRITSLVSVHSGLKGQELVIKVMSDDLTLNQNLLMDTIFDMIESGDLVEIEYSIPGVNSKSFLTPRGTLVNVVNKVRIR